MTRRLRKTDEVRLAMTVADRAEWETLLRSCRDHFTADGLHWRNQTVMYESERHAAEDGGHPNPHWNPAHAARCTAREEHADWMVRTARRMLELLVDAPCYRDGHPIDDGNGK